MSTKKATQTATETTETSTLNIPVLTKQTGPAPAPAAVQHGGGNREGSIPALVKGLEIGEWFRVALKDGKTNTSKGANIMKAARSAGIGLTRFRSEDGYDVYQRVEIPAKTEDQPTE